MTSRNRGYSIFLLLAIASGVAHAEVTVSVIPEHPLQNEQVYVRVQASGHLNSENFYKFLSYVTSVDTVEGVDFRVITEGNGQPPEGGPVDHTFYLGRLPIGRYTVDVAPSEEAPVGYAATSFEVSFPPSVIGPGHERRAGSPHDYSGMWYAPEAPGTSVVLEQSPLTRKLGGGIYLYESGRPIWYLLSPIDWLSPGMFSYEFDVFRTRGTDHRLSYDPEQSGATKVGTALAEFPDHEAMTLTVSIDDFTQTQILKRFRF